MLLINKKAPNFTAQTVFKNEVKEISLSDYKGKNVWLYFYPLDFTFVCPTELHAFQAVLSEFKARNTEILACSVDSHFTHLAWLDTAKSSGGINGVEYGIISDLGANIARAYDVLGDNIAYRASFFIDETGIVRHQSINDLPIGRSTNEALRIIDAWQHSQKYGQVCPANWHKGDEAIETSKASVSEYLSK